MVPKAAYPPIFHHPDKTRRLTPLEAQTELADFLQNVEIQAYLHPDAQLSASGITFAAQSGPRGGLAIHHLRRIEAGLRGERLGVETTEDLDKEYGPEPEAELPEGDDSKLDALIEGGTGRKGGLKRKRTSDWAATSSNADLPRDSQEALAGADDESEWQDQDEYEQSQRNLVGDVGERGANVVKQNGAPPIIAHAPDSTAEKKARRDAKKERQKIEKAERADRKAKG
ncbi:hypothetical protein LTR91_015853 [Friedmanniomyces endolithicus]|uniref:Uncharacterized protein n=1 Tax=Friedmanniomyces endolithicus TaxID=329885 RepID=A0A4U0TYY8_9PEZI|nr:hypothetical protein LTS09_003998 [Friedmanniomyces endolithicus]KAK0271048.1 hypothetical protein LTS00_016751 [Friedmanniomyces endolithicus]KAK0280707.1 hypothetical protein LTR35_007733 [Friedmanniomyces endolithicus]KAK0312472.1 hypothetical protein LTR82_013766 [Friedmanniomyces endolithicus]KAK0970559.1 hypothetical protein LTR91_015853 [Friedmanniomyces endolithicus]